jgi:hypothetical protein
MRNLILNALIASPLLLLLPQQSTAQTNPAPPGTGPVTNCSTGCTIITCNASTCTVTYCDYSGCKTVASYPRPVTSQNKLQSPVTFSGTTKHYKDTGNLSPTDASLQFATACSKTGRDCRVWVVKPEGASYLGSYDP